MAVLYSGSLLSGAFSGLIAAGITSGLDGARGLGAWCGDTLTYMRLTTLTLLGVGFSSSKELSQCKFPKPVHHQGSERKLSHRPVWLPLQRTFFSPISQGLQAGSVKSNGSWQFGDWKRTLARMIG